MAGLLALARLGSPASQEVITDPARSSIKCSDKRIIVSRDGDGVDNGGQTCRVCAAQLEVWCDLGEQPVSNHFRSSEDELSQLRYRLTGGVCSSCGAVQLCDSLPSEAMYRPGYPYRTGTSKAMATHFREAATAIVRDQLSPGGLFVEIGSNDGTLLAALAEADVRHLGVDPSECAMEDARAQGASVLIDYFGVGLANQIREMHGAADVIFSANTISHIPAVHSIYAGIKNLLSEKGKCIIEERYLGAIIDNGGLDQLYDEHIFLYSVTTVSDIASRHGLELVDVEHLNTHGGSVRYTLAHEGAFEPSAEVPARVREEQARGLHRTDRLHAFGDRILGTLDALQSTLGELRNRGMRIAGYGATSKSATILNYCSIDNGTLECVYDTTQNKIGKFMPGTDIPVRSAAELVGSGIDVAVLFAWNHAEEVLEREAQFSEGGGRWLTYVPSVKILEASSEAKRGSPE